MTTDDEILPTAEERMSDLPEPPTKAIEEVRRGNRIMVICLLIAGVAMATSFIVAAFAIGGQSEAKERAKANAALAARADLKAEGANQTAAAAASAAAEANRRLAAAGKPTVSIPSVTVTPPPPAVTEGLSGKQLIAVQSLIENALAKYQPAMSQAQIKQAATVAASLIPKPKDGHTPTAAELLPLVTAAHTAYCSDGRCEGKTGPPGPAGPSGAPGTRRRCITGDR